MEFSHSENHAGIQRAVSVRRSFPFHDLGDDEFEELARHICIKILGTGTIVFAVGKDGGRDGTFEGTAERFPSTTSPLKGKFIIQAKHTSNPVASCSDKEFAKLLDAELPKLLQLVIGGELDHYLVFTNRRKPASKAIQKEQELTKIGLRTVHIFGGEQLRTWLTALPDIWHNLGYDRFERKFEIQTNDLSELVTEFHKAIKSDGSDFQSATDFTYINKRRKNKINGLTAEYDKYIRDHSLRHFRAIENFLKNPRNENYRDLYHDSADEIKKKIIVNTAAFSSFDEALTFVFDFITAGNTTLKGKRLYVSAFLHYMYYTCDIGQHDYAGKTS